MHLGHCCNPVHTIRFPGQGGCSGTGDKFRKELGGTHTPGRAPVDGWMDWMSGWREGWIDGQMDTSVFFLTSLLPFAGVLLALSSLLSV